MSGKRFTEEEIAIVKRDYRKRPAQEIADNLGTSLLRIYRLASRLGLTQAQQLPRPEFQAFFQEKHAEGWSDSEISETWGGVDRHAVSAMRRRLGLPSNAHSPRVKAKIRKAMDATCRRYGVKSFEQLRYRAYRVFAREEGWPESLSPIQVRILNLLWERGPMTNEQLGDALGARRKPADGLGHRARYVFGCNRPVAGGTTYISDLEKFGLVIRMDRAVSGRGQGANVSLYSLPLTIERQPGKWQEERDAG